MARHERILLLRGTAPPLLGVRDTLVSFYFLLMFSLWR